MRTVLTAGEVYNIVAGWLTAMDEHRDEVNALNVFPVPDGDTGTNMYLTLQSVKTELDATPDKTVAGYGRAVKDGSLKGARGNSGVILSQILRGFCDVVIENDRIDAKIFAKALSNGAVVAYEAVMKPVEGTILTVVKDMARVARRSSRKTEDIEHLLEAVLKEGMASLERTPELLDTLKDAGVVDAGGKGLVIMAESAMFVLTGEAAWLEPPTAPAQDLKAATEEPEIDLEYTYCTEFFLKKTDVTPTAFRSEIEHLGGSLMVVGDDDVIKTHIHTNDPGLVLAAATAKGEISGLKIDNMREQTATKAAGEAAEKTEQKPLAIVAVAVGAGTKDILSSLGVSVIVDGGQTMNPSAEDIVKAVEAAPGDSVLILPNNKNIILTAKQVAALTDKPIYVVPTRAVTEAFSALLQFDETAALEANGAAMERAAQSVLTGEVTMASRDSKVNKKKIKKGEVIGIARGDLITSGGTISATVLKLVKKMMNKDKEVITLLRGADMPHQDVEELRQKIAEKYPDAEINVYYGGQPLYPLIIGIE
jgi:hypothetical protein